jgi:hypothetical protein
MKTQVRIDPRCVIDIGQRTPDRRLLVKEYIKKVQDDLANLGGLIGAIQVGNNPDEFVWKDTNWQIGYTVEMRRGRHMVTIVAVELVRQ